MSILLPTTKPSAQESGGCSKKEGHLDTPAFSLGGPRPRQQPLQHTLHIGVPEAVDEWVQHGAYDGDESANAPVLVRGGHGAQAHVAEEASSIKDADRGEVGATREEGFLPALCRADPQDCSCHVGVGHRDEDHGDYPHEGGPHKKKLPIEVDAGAGELEKGREVTVEVVDHVRAAEVQHGHSHRVGQSIDEGNGAADGHRAPWTSRLMWTL